MIRKRIIGAITVRQGIAVQSFGYGRYLPLGKPEVLALNFDRWGADEIIVSCIDRTGRGEGPDLPLLERIAGKGLSTPLVYGGGIRDASDARAVIGSGADRVSCDALLRDDPNKLRAIGEAIGIQGVIGSIPLSLQNGQLAVYDYRTRMSQPVTPALRDLLGSGFLSELLITDWRHEGQQGGFDPMLAAIGSLGVPLILFGGISYPGLAASLLAKPYVVAVAIGNFLSYREHAIQSYREAVGAAPLRQVEYRHEGD